MTINITSGKSGWGNYVLYGTKEKPRDSELVEFLEGDIPLGDRLSQSNNYEESYYKIVLAFEGKPSDEVMKSAYEDFKKEMFVGFKENEYHIDAVIHKDTDNYHIHARVPKQNLKTDTHLQLYMDKIDRPRKELIQDYISLKYGLAIAREQNREIFKEESHEHINKWREEHNQKPFDFKSKEGKEEAEKQINSYIADLTKSGLIDSTNDIKSTLEELGLNVDKFGKDEKKDFSYVTVSNETGKMRVKGEIYNERFWEHSREDRSSQINNNQRIIEQREPHQERAERVRKELNRANEKRFNKVQELFKSARARAESEHTKTLENGRLESLNSTKHIKPSNRINIRNTDTKTSNEIGAVYRGEKFSIKRQQQLSPLQRNRANLRQDTKSILLQNKLKDKSNDIIGREIITRSREQREASATALQRARSSREFIQERASRDYKELQNGVIKIANYYGKIREKVVEKIEQTKQSLTERLEKIKEKYLPKKEVPEVQKEETPLFKKDERLEKLIEKMEAGTGSKSDSSNLEEKKELTSREKFELQKEAIRQQEKEKIKEVPELQKEEESTKKRSYQRQR